jgi:hypothetical protein
MEVQSLGFLLKLPLTPPLSPQAGAREMPARAPRPVANGEREGPSQREGEGHSGYQTAGRARMSSGILRGRNWPSARLAWNWPFSTTILPRRIVMLGQAATSWPSHGV